MVKKEEPTEPIAVHEAQLQVIGHDPNWLIQFICCCGKEIAVAPTFTLPDLTGYAINHMIEYTGQSLPMEDEDVGEAEADS